VVNKLLKKNHFGPEIGCLVKELSKVGGQLEIFYLCINVGFVQTLARLLKSSCW
jgi:hypothetical protein